MVRQKGKQQKRQVSRMAAYALGHRPDEFALFPDEEGFIPIKEFIAALREEDGWSFIRESHIAALIREPEETRFEIRDKMIRVFPGDSHIEPGPFPEAAPPRLLFHAARRRAWPVILEHGLVPTGERSRVALYQTRELALRAGLRRDPEPVLLTILAERAYNSRVKFFRPQELIYLVDRIEPEFISGPPLPKEKEQPERKKPAPPPEPPAPGSFILEPDRAPHPERRKKDSDWKRARRRGQRDKY